MNVDETYDSWWDWPTYDQLMTIGGPTLQPACNVASLEIPHGETYGLATWFAEFSAYLVGSKPAILDILGLNVGLLDGLLGVAGMIITSDYGSFPKIPCV